MLTRDIEAETLPVVRALGIAVIAYGVLARGLIGGASAGHFAAPGNARATFFPRFRGVNLEKNRGLVDALAAVATEKGTTAAQLAIAWVLDQGDDIVPLVGARRRDRLREALGALDVHLTAEDHARIAAAVPDGAVAGDPHGVKYRPLKRAACKQSPPQSRIAPALASTTPTIRPLDIGPCRAH